MEKIYLMFFMLLSLTADAQLFQEKKPIFDNDIAVDDIYYDKLGFTWIITSTGKVYRYDGVNKREVNVPNINPEGISIVAEYRPGKLIFNDRKSFYTNSQNSLKKLCVVDFTSKIKLFPNSNTSISDTVGKEFIPLRDYHAFDEKGNLYAPHNDSIYYFELNKILTKQILNLSDGINLTRLYGIRMLPVFGKPAPICIIEKILKSKKRLVKVYKMQSGKINFVFEYETDLRENSNIQFSKKNKPDSYLVDFDKASNKSLFYSDGVKFFYTNKIENDEVIATYMLGKNIYIVCNKGIYTCNAFSKKEPTSIYNYKDEFKNTLQNGLNRLNDTLLIFPGKVYNFKTNKFYSFENEKTKSFLWFNAWCNNSSFFYSLGGSDLKEYRINLKLPTKNDLQYKDAQLLDNKKRFSYTNEDQVSLSEDSVVCFDYKSSRAISLFIKKKPYVLKGDQSLARFSYGLYIPKGYRNFGFFTYKCFLVRYTFDYAKLTMKSKVIKSDLWTNGLGSIGQISEKEFFVSDDKNLYTISLSNLIEKDTLVIDKVTPYSTPNLFDMLVIDGKLYTYEVTNYDITDYTLIQNSIPKWKYNISDFAQSKNQSTLYLTELLINNIPQAPCIECDSIYGLPNNLKLAYDKNTITFNYSVISQHINTLLKIKYRVIGYDDKWQFIETDKIELKKLLPGKYTLEIWATNEDGVWNPKPLSYSFEILPPWYKTYWAYSGYVLLLMGSVYGFSSARTRQLKKKQIELENTITERTEEIVLQKNKVEEAYEELHQQNEEIAAQRDEIEKQKHKVEEHQQEIIDSLNYAKRLQNAILPPLNHIQQFIPETFILYKPKDIVAGDFYWFEEKGDYIYLAAADCTGHGVPGAMVSVVCSNALNRALTEFDKTETGTLLDKVRELVVSTFEKSGEEVKDGMDISLIRVNKITREVQWSGANNPLWYIHEGTITEVKADKQPIGKYAEEKPFLSNTITLEKGSVLYLFTDGYADQFGGPKGKKFKYKQFEELLVEIHTMPMNEQSVVLNKKFEEWKGSLEQIDDVCVIGVKI